LIEEIINVNGCWVNSVNALCEDVRIEATTKNRVCASLQHLSLEHFAAIHILLSKQHYGSAFSLLRPQFESYIRGVWFSFIATDIELDKFVQKDELKPTFGKLISDLEKLELYQNGELSGIKKKIWGSLCSYTHGGAYQLALRNKADAIENDISEKELIQLLFLSNDLALLSLGSLAKIGNQPDISLQASVKHNELFNRYKTYTKAFKRN
jgi:hypothetical protein